MGNQKRGSQLVGFFPSGNNLSTTTVAMSAAATWVGLGFTAPDGSKTLSKIRARVSALTGTWSVSCDLYSDTGAGVPNSSVESTSTVTSTPVGATWVEFTGFTTTLTAGDQYWLVFKNTSGTPASNFPTLQTGQSNTIPVGATSGLGWTKRHSTDSGSTWTATTLPNASGWRVEYGDGTFDGFPLQSVADSAVGTYVYSDRENGVKFTTPANGRMVVRAAGMSIRNLGTPAADARFRLYEGTSLLGTTYTLPKGVVSGANTFYSRRFSTPLTLTAGAAHRLVLGEATNSDTNSNTYRSLEFTIENDANSKTLLPLGAQQTYWNGSTWTETDTVILPFWLVLDTDGEFGAVASGGLPSSLME